MEVLLFLKVAELPYNTLWDRSKLEGSSRAKTSAIRSAVSTEHRLVTDRQTDGHMHTTRASIASRG